MSSRLAIDGGTPVRDRPLPYARHVVDEADILAVADVLRGDWLTTGPAVADFEKAFAGRVGAKWAIAVSSGTAALHAAAFAAGIGPGDEVVTSPMTFAATANCVLYCGGKPVFADVQGSSCNLTPDSIEKALTDKTKAVAIVDYAGQPADLDAIHDLAAKRNLVMIEDAAHALGATYKQRPVGRWAHLTAFSTHPAKHIATGEGGMVTTDDEKLAETLRAFRNHGIRHDAHARARSGAWFYTMDFLGYNYRLSDIACALGWSQLQKLDGWLARRREIVAQYAGAFSRMEELEPPIQRPGREHAWHLYVTRIRPETLKVDRTQVFRALRAEGIQVNVHYIPVYWHPHYQALGYTHGLCPVAEAEYERMITLPLWHGMTRKDADDVIEAVNKVFDAYRR